MIKELKILYRNEQSSEESLKAYWSPRKLQVEFIFLISAKNNKLDFRQLEPHAITTIWWTFKISCPNSLTATLNYGTLEQRQIPEVGRIFY